MFLIYRLQLLVGLIFLLSFSLGYAAIHRRPLVFSYGGNNCFRDFTLFPSLHRSKGVDYELQFPKTKSLAGMDILSTRSCVVPTAAPIKQQFTSLGLSVVGIPIIGKQFSVHTPGLPKLDAVSLRGRVSIRDSLAITMDKTDMVFQYRIEVNDRSQQCRVVPNAISCGVDKLDFAQNRQYRVIIRRLFNRQDAGTALSLDLQTTDPVGIASASVGNGAVVYDVPQSVVIDTTKDVEYADIQLESTDGEKVEYTKSISGNRVKLNLVSALPRRKTYRLAVNDLVAKDKGVLLTPFISTFTTSGGPRVIGANIGSNSAHDGREIVVSLDQSVLTSQDISSMVSVVVAGSPVSVNISSKDNKLHIRPKGAWGRCTPFTIKLSSTIQSTYGVDGDSSWQFNSRTICYSIEIIGHSVSGRAIQAWRFGSGPKKLLYVGATHGDERSTKAILDEWIKDLDANPTKIPADKSIVVIPSVNPDGFAANKRVNARGVDLNRNFPANDWKSDVTMPGGGALVTAGAGLVPLSEPESKALASFILSERPALTITYHSVASVVSGNNSGKSDILAIEYAKQSRYRYLPKSDTNQVFQYDTTGAFEDWLHDKQDMPCILVELGSDTRSDFVRNKTAMWALVGNF